MDCVIEFRPRDFMQTLYEQRRELMQMFNREPKRLLVGAEDFAQMMRHPDVGRQAFQFEAEYSMGGGAKNRPRICGLEVEVIPWMRGILVMP